MQLNYILWSISFQNMYKKGIFVCHFLIDYFELRKFCAQCFGGNPLWLWWQKPMKPKVLIFFTMAVSYYLNSIRLKCICNTRKTLQSRTEGRFGRIDLHEKDGAMASGHTLNFAYVLYSWKLHDKWSSYKMFGRIFQE